LTENIGGMSLEAGEVAWVTRHMHHFRATVSDIIF